jgi:hypothetical protein
VAFLQPGCKAGAGASRDPDTGGVGRNSSGICIDPDDYVVLDERIRGPGYAGGAQVLRGCRARDRVGDEASGLSAGRRREHKDRDHYREQNKEPSFGHGTPFLESNSATEKNRSKKIMEGAFAAQVKSAHKITLMIPVWNSAVLRGLRL